MALEVNTISNTKIILNVFKTFQGRIMKTDTTLLCVCEPQNGRGIDWYSYWPQLFTVLGKFSGVLLLVRLVYPQLPQG